MQADPRRHAPKLRIGVTISGCQPPQWQHDLIGCLQAAEGVGGVVAIPRNTAREPLGLWHWFARRSPRLRRRPLPVQLEAKANSELDLVVDAAATDDVPMDHRCVQSWLLCDGASRLLAAAFPGIVELSAGQGGSVSLIEGGQVIREARFFAHPPYWIGLERLYAEAIRLVVQALKDRWNGVARAPLAQTPRPGHRRAPRVARELLSGIARSAFRRARAWVVEESWMIGVVDRPIASVAASPSLTDIQWIGPRRTSRCLADPFGLPGASDRVYCEELRTFSREGAIKELTLRGTRIASEQFVPLRVRGHASYPYLLVDEEQLYCIPETIASRRCSLYCLDPRRGWVLVANPVADGVAAADPTLFRWEGRYWLAYTDADDEAFSVLCLCYADRLAGPWRTHANNPVKIDHRSARPAGTPFVQDGFLFRPAQDCSATYGGAITINRVTLCTPSAFREEVVGVLRPQLGGANPDGLHTLSAWGSRTLVDGKCHQVNAFALGGKFYRRLRPLKKQPQHQCVP